MEIEAIVSLMVNNGLAVGVVIYLLWERTKFMSAITEVLTKLDNTTQLIKDYFINDNK